MADHTSNNNINNIKIVEIYSSELQLFTPNVQRCKTVLFVSAYTKEGNNLLKSPNAVGAAMMLLYKQNGCFTRTENSA